MAKRTFPLIASVLTATVLFTVVAHACSDLSDVKAILQMPCEHSSSQSESHDRPKKHDCTSIRYGMLSTQASSAEPELSKVYSIAFEDAVLAGFALPAWFLAVPCPAISWTCSFIPSFSHSSPHLSSVFFSPCAERQVGVKGLPCIFLYLACFAYWRLSGSQQYLHVNKEQR